MIEQLCALRISPSARSPPTGKGACRPPMQMDLVDQAGRKPHRVKRRYTAESLYLRSHPTPGAARWEVPAVYTPIRDVYGLDAVRYARAGCIRAETRGLCFRERRHSLRGLSAKGEGPSAMCASPIDRHERSRASGA